MIKGTIKKFHQQIQQENSPSKRKCFSEAFDITREQNILEAARKRDFKSVKELIIKVIEKSYGY